MYVCESWTIKKAEHQRTDAFLNCNVGEDSWESLGLQEDQTSQSWRKLTLNIHWKVWAWSWSFNTLTILSKEPTNWKRPRCWERLKAGGEGKNRGQDGRMASPTQWTWVWANFRRQWGCRVRRKWVTEQQHIRTDFCINQVQFFSYQLIIWNFPWSHRCELREHHQCNNTEWCGSQGYLFIWLICDFWS